MVLKSHPALKMMGYYLTDSPQPLIINYFWKFGSLFALCLIIQIITGMTLGMHYTPNVLEAFDSVEHIMRDVNSGFLIRLSVSYVACFYFFLVYLHIEMCLYHKLYESPIILTRKICTVIIVLMMFFLLFYGQMSKLEASFITLLLINTPNIFFVEKKMHSIDIPKYRVFFTKDKFIKGGAVRTVRHFSSTRTRRVNLNELKRLKEENEASLIQSDRDTLDNRTELNEVNAQILEIQMQNIANLPAANREQVLKLMDRLIEKRESTCSEVDSMESEDLGNEVKKSSLEFSITSTNTELTKGIDAVISPILGDLGLGYRQLQVRRDEVQRNGESLHVNHTHLVNKELDLSEQIRNHDKNNNNTDESLVNKDKAPNNSESNQTPGQYIDNLPREHNPFEDLGED